jgi:hypothetical protein
MDGGTSSSISGTVSQRLQGELEDIVGSLYEAFGVATDKEQFLMWVFHIHFLLLSISFYEFCRQGSKSEFKQKYYCILNEMVDPSWVFLFVSTAPVPDSYVIYSGFNFNKLCFLQIESR